jgi:hypothetical protein
MPFDLDSAVRSKILPCPDLAALFESIRLIGVLPAFSTLDRSRESGWTIGLMMSSKGQKFKIASTAVATEF